MEGLLILWHIMARKLHKYYVVTFYLSMRIPNDMHVIQSEVSFASRELSSPFDSLLISMFGCSIC
jgi:hypothetical protein